MPFGSSLQPPRADGEEAHCLCPTLLVDVACPARDAGSSGQERRERREPGGPGPGGGGSRDDCRFEIVVGSKRDCATFLSLRGPPSADGRKRRVNASGCFAFAVSIASTAKRGWLAHPKRGSFLLLREAIYGFPQGLEGRRIRLALLAILP
ncbi:unnamed protein product [Sphagnum tenellum]